MTSVLSLAVGGVNSYTFATSALLAVEAGGFKAVDLNEFTQLAGHDVGALWISRDNAYSYGSGAWHGMRWGSLAYDTGSWTDANSVGVFRVPNRKWDVVHIGVTWRAKKNNDGACRIIKIALGQNSINNSSIGYPYITHNHDGTVDLVQMGSSFIKVDSGDVLQAQMYMSSVFSEAADIAGFWIRGYTARG